MKPISIVCWFAKAYRAIGLEGCSSHSGRRTFITRAARSGAQGGRLPARRPAPGRAPVDPDHPAVYRRRHRCPAQARFIDLIDDDRESHCKSGRRRGRRQTSIDYEPPALDHAIRLIHQVCCLAGSFDLIKDFRDQALCAAVDRHDTAALFDRLMHDFSFQGISDEIAANYMTRHGQATWRSVRKNLAKRPNLPEAAKPIGIFMLADTKKRAAPAPSLTTLPPARCQLIGCETAISTRLPTASICLFATLPVAIWWAGSMISWTRRTILLRRTRLAQGRTALIEPLRNVYGVSDKVLAMALSGILIGAADVRPKWLQVGAAADRGRYPGP